MAERRTWRAVDAELFRFTTTDLRDLHVALMTAFEEAAVLAPALNLDQVRVALSGAGWDEPVDAPDPLSSTVSVLGLRPELSGRAGPLVTWLRSAADAREPAVLTLSQLRRWPVGAHPSTSPVFAIENPSLLMEAASRSWDGPVLVCSSGRPTVAVVTLLRQLGANGAVLYQHADFDPAGLSITTWLADRVGTVPSRRPPRDEIRSDR